MNSTDNLEQYQTLLKEEKALRENLEKQLQWQADLSNRLNLALNEAEILQAVASLTDEFGADSLSLSYIDVDEANNPEWMENVAGYERHGDPPPTGMRFYLPDFPFADLWEGLSEPLFIGNFKTDERVDEATRKLVVEQFHIQAAVHIPLIHTNRWVGLLFCNWSQPHEFSKTEMDIFQIMMHLLSATVGNHRLFLQELKLNEQFQVEIQEREQAEAALKESQKRLEHLLKTSPTVIYSSKIEGERFLPTFVSENIKHLFGYDPEAVLTDEQFWVNNLHPDDAPRVFNDLGNLFVQGEHQHDYRFYFPSGDYHWIHDEMKLVYDENGTPIEVIGSWMDITEQRAANLKYREMQQQIIEAQQRAIEELSTPIIPVMEGIIVMPLIGSVDSIRAKDLMRTLLKGISEHRAKIVILDITGVALIDTGIAAALDKTIQSARLKGARTIITGISDGVAETVIDLGIDWSKVETLRDLQTGLMVALNSLGIQLIADQSHKIN